MLVDDIFDEYVRMRENGLESKSALQALRSFVERLNKENKEVLAQKMRQWERNNTDETRITPSAPPPPILLGDTPLDETNRWIECPNCHKKNRINEVFCYACGHMLETSHLRHETQHFADATDDLFSDEFYGDESVVQLTPRDSQIVYEVRPQLRQHEMVIGRSANGALPPDIDLAGSNAADLGVSRLHLAMRYEPKDHALLIYDLGSSNGSYVNGQKLQPKELRLLRSGDELRLGRLVLRVKFMHPGQKLG